MLQSVNANEQAVYQSQSTSNGSSAFDAVKANSVQQKPRDKNKRHEKKEDNSKMKGLCINFQKGTCTNANCRFKHEKAELPNNSVSATTPAPVSAYKIPSMCLTVVHVVVLISDQLGQMWLVLEYLSH